MIEIDPNKKEEKRMANSKLEHMDLFAHALCKDEMISGNDNFSSRIKFQITSSFQCVSFLIKSTMMMVKSTT
jgi:hypothetical protein